MFQLPILLVLAMPAWSDAQPAEVRRLIKQLGSDSYAEREAASRALEALQNAAASSRDGEVRRRARQVVEAVQARLHHELRRFEGHQGPVFSVAFSPDSKRALSGSADRTVRLWRLPR
jgi:hypothetical protein